jgi:hypothetical protein
MRRAALLLTSDYKAADEALRAATGKTPATLE